MYLLNNISFANRTLFRLLSFDVTMCLEICVFDGNNILFQITIEQHEDCHLIDNSGITKWRIKNSKGDEALVPALVFLIPPPDGEAGDVTNRYGTAFFFKNIIHQ